MNRNKAKEDAKKYRSTHTEHYAKLRRTPRVYVRSWARNTISGHRKCGYDVNISIDELVEIANNSKICPICDRGLNWSSDNKNGRACSTSPSLDRINNEQCLNKTNVWIICHSCNSKKRDDTMEQLVTWCKRIVEKFGEHEDVV